jgi:uncharacterized protein (TIGR03118 family)
MRYIVLSCFLSLAACGGYGDSATGNGAAPAPVVTLEVQPATVRLGESAQLMWTASPGASCIATDGWSETKPTTGTQSVTPAVLGAVVYTLTCRTPTGGQYSASADVAKSVTVNVVPANAFTNTALAADTASALVLDARLVNPWGVAMSATSTAWVTNSHTDTSTLYDGNGRAQPAGAPRTVVMPVGVNGVPFEPTGIVANAGAGFVIHGATDAPARFIFAGKRGSLAGWSPTVDANRALDVYDDPTSAYTGLAIARVGDGDFLYAADFHNARVDVFDTAFAKQATSATRFTFVDPDLPAGFAPFGIQALNTGAGGAAQIYVTYAKQLAPDNRSSVRGAGMGRVDVYDTNGVLLKKLVVQTDRLDAPWGIALAPADFGALGNRLLIANFGDGRINSFGLQTGQFGATLSDSHGTPVSIPGLRGIAFGNDTNNQPHNTLFYAAGTNDEANGTFGRLDPGAIPPLLN